MYMHSKNFRGILFIGDPHVCSKKIGRRKDDYLTSVLGKLEACAEICTVHHLLPVILGDLLHRSDDNSLRMLNRLIKVLKKFPVLPITLEGNHDKEKTKLSEDDALSLIGLSDKIHIIDAEGEVARITVNGELVRLWGCPHGSAIPAELPFFEGRTIMVTHHDMAFGSEYIGAFPLTEVLNCGMVVNGHMHDTKKSVKAGSTWWTNPGNIEPLSLDLIGHLPRAWEWSPEGDLGSLKGHDLPHGTDLFDLTGTQVAAADAEVAVTAMLAEGITAPEQSKFAQLIRNQAESEAQKTDDASVLAEDLEAVLGASGASDATRMLMQSILGALRSTATT